MALKLAGQFFHMFPLKSGFVESCVGSHMVRHEVNFLALQKSERPSPDLIERCIIRNAGVRKESKDLSCLLQIPVPLDSAFIYALFGDAPCLTNVFPDIIDEAVDQVIMDFLVAVIDKAQKIDIHNPLIKLAQPEDGIIGH